MRALGDWLSKRAAFVTDARTGFVASAALLAFVLQPYVRFLELGAWGGAMLLCLAVIGFYGRLNEAGSISAMLVGVAGLWFLISAFNGAVGNSAANDRRCAHIQHQMLTSPSGRADAATMFAALGCQPRGNEMAIFPSTPAQRSNKP